MRKAATLLVSLAAIMIVVGGFMTQSLMILQRVAAVDAVEGMVWLQQRGHDAFVPLADRPRVAAGDTIRTDARSRVDLRYVDGTRLRIGPSSRITVLKDQIRRRTQDQTTMFKLDVGRVWIRILKVLSQKSKFEIATPTATAGVRGTIFSVEVTPEGQTRVSVREGKVAVKSGATEAQVAEGQMMDDGGAQAMAEDERALWDDNETVALPHLQVHEPAAALTVAPNETIKVSGVTEPRATVTINGRPQTLRLEKLFATDLQAPAQPGKFEIVIEAKDRRGFISREALTVTVR
jgi:hypothetical protein